MPDGTVQIQFGDLTGYVSSYHLVQPKLNQLQTAWLKLNPETSDSIIHNDSD